MITYFDVKERQYIFCSRSIILCIVMMHIGDVDAVMKLPIYKYGKEVDENELLERDFFCS